MYRCQNCGQVQPPREKENKIVVKQRMVNHPERKKQIAEGKYIVLDKGGRGSQIMKEITVCDKCLP